MIKRSDRLKAQKRKVIDICMSILLLNILLSVISIMLILSEALTYKNIRLYLSAGLIVCIILGNITLYKSRKKPNSEFENLNSIEAKNRIYNSKFDIYQSKDNLTGLYNHIFLKNLLKKINTEKFIPTTIGIFHVQGFASILNEEMKTKVLCNVANIVLKNKLKSNIACISENNNIIICFINYSKEDSRYVCKNICDEFNGTNKCNNIRLIYGLESMHNNEESIYNVLGHAVDFINL